MAESQNKQNERKVAEATPAQAGRLQEGEQHEGAVTTRVPRGVNEPAADAEASEKGLKSAQKAVRDTVAEESEKGYRGTQADPTPNENYTVAGVTSGKPTPETTVVTPKGQ